MAGTPLGFNKKDRQGGPRNRFLILGKRENADVFSQPSTQGRG